MGNLNFDATGIDPTQSAGQLPISDALGHVVTVMNTEMKPTKENDGGYLELTLAITQGQFVGNTGPFRLNLYNKEPKAVGIAYKQLSAICHATGRFQVADHEHLRGAEFRVVVSAQKNDAQYTEVKKILDIHGNEPGKPAVNTTPPTNAAFQQPTQQQPATNGFQQQPQTAPVQGFGQQPVNGGFQQPAAADNSQQPNAWQQPGQQVQQQPATQAQGFQQPQQPAQQPAPNAWTQQPAQAAAPWGAK